MQNDDSINKQELVTIKDDNVEITSVIPKSKTLLDLLTHEVQTIIGSDKTFKRLEKILLHPKILETLSFEQIMTYMDRILRKQKESREFIIDFYRVNSKSATILSSLEKFTTKGSASADTTNTENPYSEENEKLKQHMIEKMIAYINTEEAEGDN